MKFNNFNAPPIFLYLNKKWSWRTGWQRVWVVICCQQCWILANTHGWCLISFLTFYPLLYFDFWEAWLLAKMFVFSVVVHVPPFEGRCHSWNYASFSFYLWIIVLIKIYFLVVSLSLSKNANAVLEIRLWLFLHDIF
jgi:hypothetical protein